MKKVITILITILLFLSTGLEIKAQKIGTRGYFHSISLSSDGTIFTWGDNAYGQLGDNSTTDSNIPVAVYNSGVLSGKTITAIAAGDYHSITLASDGTVYTWGDNNNGKLGNSSYTDSNVPVAVNTSGVLSGKTITAIAGGANHSIALASDGTVYTWGDNFYGQLGNNNNTESTVPVAVYTSGVLSGKTITAIASGKHHSIALDSDGTVYSWGDNTYGNLGNNSTTKSNVPVAVNTSGVLSGKTITAIAGGAFHSMALASDGTVYDWGAGGNGQLGNNNSIDSKVPVAVYTSGVLSGKTITAIAAGGAHSIALDSDGIVYSWGYGGRLGDGTNSSSIVPVAVYTSGVLSGKTITAIAGGELHGVALASDDYCYTWGDNAQGQLGNGNSPTDSNVPVLVSGGALPVELISFSASVTSSTVTLIWQTATELNNYGFEIERKIPDKVRNDNGVWEKIGFVTGHGNSNTPINYSFTDVNLLGGVVFYYRLKQIDVDGKFEYSDILTVSLDVPEKAELMQNSPNPFNPSTAIKFFIPNSSDVTIKIYDVLGKEITTLINQQTQTGFHIVFWNGRDKFGNNASSGVYFYRLTAVDTFSGLGQVFSETKKMTLLK